MNFKLQQTYPSPTHGISPHNTLTYANKINSLILYGQQKPNPQTQSQSQSEQPKKKIAFKATPSSSTPLSDKISIFSLTDRKWSIIQTKGKIPSSRTQFKSIYIQPCLLIYGGKINSKNINQIYALNCQTWIWKKLFSLDGPPISDQYLFFKISSSIAGLIVHNTLWLLYISDVKWQLSANQLPGSVWQKINIILPDNIQFYWILDDGNILIVGKNKTIKINVYKKQKIGQFSFICDRLIGGNNDKQQNKILDTYSQIYNNNNKQNEYKLYYIMIVSINSIIILKYNQLMQNIEQISEQMYKIQLEKCIKCSAYIKRSINQQQSTNTNTNTGIGANNQIFYLDPKGQLLSISLQLQLQLQLQSQNPYTARIIQSPDHPPTILRNNSCILQQQQNQDSSMLIPSGSNSRTYINDSTTNLNNGGGGDGGRDGGRDGNGNNYNGDRNRNRNNKKIRRTQQQYDDQDDFLGDQEGINDRNKKMDIKQYDNDNDHNDDQFISEKIINDRLVNSSYQAILLQQNIDNNSQIYHNQDRNINDRNNTNKQQQQKYGYHKYNNKQRQDSRDRDELHKSDGNTFMKQKNTRNIPPPIKVTYNNQNLSINSPNNQKLLNNQRFKYKTEQLSSLDNNKSNQYQPSSNINLNIKNNNNLLRHNKQQKNNNNLSNQIQLQRQQIQDINTTNLKQTLRNILYNQSIKRKLLQSKIQSLQNIIRKSQKFILMICHYGNINQKKKHIEKVKQYRQELQVNYSKEIYYRKQMQGNKMPNQVNQQIQETMSHIQY